MGSMAAPVLTPALRGGCGSWHLPIASLPADRTPAPMHRGCLIRHSRANGVGLWAVYFSDHSAGMGRSERAMCDIWWQQAIGWHVLQADAAITAPLCQ